MIADLGFEGISLTEETEGNKDAKLSSKDTKSDKPDDFLVRD